MKKNKLENNINKARINIYNILAILIVIIPEFIAEIIYAIEISYHNNKLPKDNEVWEKNTELKLSRMNIYELRLMAKKLLIHGYSSDNRHSLIRRIKKKTQKRISRKSINS